MKNYLQFIQNYLKFIKAGILKIISNANKIIPRIFNKTSPYKLNS